MATYREKRLARAERLSGWADSRELKSDAAYETANSAVAGIEPGQPILIGHHSQRRHERALNRAHSAMSASVEHSRKASEMRSRAENIEAATRNAIYDDDPDAIERLRDKLAALEAERETIKAYNATCRKAAKAGDGIGDLSLLTDELRADVLGSVRIGFAREGGAFPAYKLTNLGGNISRARDRIAALERAKERGPVDRTISARYPGSCADCGAGIERGQTIRYSKSAGARCVSCEVQT